MSEAKIPNKNVVVMYVPLWLTGHLVPTVELGKQLVAHGLEVTVVASVEAGGDDDHGGAAVAGIAAANPSLSFHCLPASTLPSGSDAGSVEARFFGLVQASNPDLREFLRSSASPTPAALLLDLFCSTALDDVGAELGIPTYFFISSSLSSLALCLYLPVLAAVRSRDLVHAPGLPPIPADHLLHSWSDKFFLDMSQHMCNSEGVIVNTCSSLEPRAAHAIVSGLCTPPGRRTPPIYCVGPLIKASPERHECLAWLDGQPKASVVFLCFGSMGRFGAKQVGQIAAGLEASGQRFLWAVRPPPPGDDDDDGGLGLDGGFLERAGGRGLVLRSWAPQQQVLAHAAVGGFVTHCGWNSVLEAVVAGVPMLAWPLYAEQHTNKVFLVEEMRLAEAMGGYGKGMVEAEEVAAKVKWLMESHGGSALRQRAQAAKKCAEEALSGDGESKAALVNLARQFKSSHA